MDIFLCRHGRTDHNSNGIVQGYLEVELNEKGEEQSRRLARRFSDHDIDAIYSSPLVRSVQTARIVAEETGIDFKRLKDLREVDQGIYEGEEVEKMMEDMRAADVEDHNWTPEGGESMEDLRERCMELLQMVREEHKGEKVLLVGHGGINKAIILAALGHSTRNFNRIKQDNCCVNRIVAHDREGWIIESVNDTRHLED